MSLYDFIQVNINLIVFYALYLAIERGTIHRVYNRIYLLATPIIAVLIPFIKTSYHDSNSEILTSLPLVQVLAQSKFTDPVEKISYTLWIYAFFAGIGLTILIWQLIRINKSPPAKFIKKEGRISIYYLEDEVSSYSFMNKAYINPLESDDLNAILQHEIAHSKQLHSVDLIIAEIYESLLWFNPILRLYTKKMKLNHEFLADQVVLKTMDKAEYQNCILNVAFSTKGLPISSGFKSKSNIYNRIKKLNHKNQNHMKHLVIFPIAICLGLMTVSMTVSKSESNLKTTRTEFGEDEVTKAQFPGGQQALMTFLMDNIIYPKDLADKNIEGKVFVEFTIMDDGTVIDATIARSSGHQEFDLEAVRVVNEMPNWTPAMENGTAVKAKMTLPFLFQLAK